MMMRKYTYVIELVRTFSGRSYWHMIAIMAVVRFDADPSRHQEERVPAAEQIILREPIREVIDASSDDDGGEDRGENSRSSLLVEQHTTLELSLNVSVRG
jgi:hypothetical protein